MSHKIKMRAADAFLVGLKQLGIDYIFGNIGTEYPPVVESLARFATKDEIGKTVPIPYAIPHENVTGHMGVGYYLSTGKTQCVMVHTGVGTANAMVSMINANRAQVPMIVVAGLAPGTENYDRTSKPGFIHWAQQMYDQGAMVREIVKWDYVITSDNVGELDLILKRAYTMANSNPKGVVYITFDPTALERDIEFPKILIPEVTPSKAFPDQTTIAEAATILASAKKPLVITGGTTKDPKIMEVLKKFAEAHSIGVAQHKPRTMHFPFNHELNVCVADPSFIVNEADCLLVLETDVPYIPVKGGISEDCKLIQIAPDTSFQRYPRNGFPYQLKITADVAEGVVALDGAMPKTSDSLKKERKDWISDLKERNVTKRLSQIEGIESGSKITYPWISHCIAELCKEDDDIILVREFSLDLDWMQNSDTQSYFGEPNAGGLGWGAGSTLGVALGQPDKVALLATGDGCYYFGVPAAAHSVSRTRDIPYITVIYNNGHWGTVAMFTDNWYPEMKGTNNHPMTDLGPYHDFENIVTAFGGVGIKVEKPNELLDALRRAVKEVKENRKQVVLNVIV
ncbi:MAG: thiamine pyrophosphate-requiring protein [Allomuricauda sp.]|nr:MAG: thiamine pyrophosphate-requiring protein [Allomuricauda sp.]